MDPLNIPSFHFRWGFEASNLTQVPLQPSVHILDSNHAHCIMSLHLVMALGQIMVRREKIASLPEMEALHGQKTVF